MIGLFFRRGKKSSWERRDVKAPTSAPAESTLFVRNDAPVIKLALALGGSQELALRRLQVRIDHNGLFFRELDRRLAAEIHVRTHVPVGRELVIVGGRNVECLRPNVFIVPENPGAFFGAESLYSIEATSDSSYRLFALSVDRIAAKTGVIDLNVIFASRSNPIDPKILEEFLGEGGLG